MRFYVKRNISVLLIAVAGLVSAFLIYNFPSADAFNARFIEKVGEGFMAPACGSTSADPTFICNADGTVTARIHWYPEKRLKGIACSDGLDNENAENPCPKFRTCDDLNDGLIDYPADPECSSPSDNSESLPGLQTVQCSDGIDNDGDGKTDYPNDPGCIGGPGVNFEAHDKPQCSNGIDDPDPANNNDIDGFIDYPQSPNCSSPNDDSENYDISGAPQNKTPACSDGADNDGNSLTDYPADPGCASAIDPQEYNPISWCKYVNFWDDTAPPYGYFGLDTPCYKGPIEGYLWTNRQPNTTYYYRIYSSELSEVGGHNWSPTGLDVSSGTFTTPTCSAGFTLTVNSAGATGVDITSSTGHGGTTNYNKTGLASGAAVSLTAPTVAGFVFNGWSGGGPTCAGANPCSVTMDANKAVTANYNPSSKTVDLTATPSSRIRNTGDFTVNWNFLSGSPICNVICDWIGMYLIGASDDSWVAWNWADGNPTGSLNFSSDFNLGAYEFRYFEASLFGVGTKLGTSNRVDIMPPGFVLTVNSAGVAGVDITSSTGHGGTTNYNKTGLASGAAVSLTAPTVAGFVFNGWSGGGPTCAGANPCSVTMDANKAVTANYTAVASTFILTVKSTVASGANITGSPASAGGTANPAGYTRSFDSGTSVILTANPVAGFTFNGWSLGCAGANPCNVTMDSNKTVTANYSIVAITSLSCSVSPSSITKGNSATWTANATGGTPPYTFTWTSNNAEGPSGIGNPKTVIYNQTGTKTGSVSVNDTMGQSRGPVACNNSLTVADPECADRIDNDDDGLKDCEDPGCHSDGNPNNPTSCVGTDNDERNSTFREIFIPFRRALAMILGI